MCVVNTLLQRSGQNFPAKYLTRETNSVQVYDVEHWPDVFNTLLIHDFPSIIVSFDTSTASLSGFIVTLTWRSPVNASAWISILVHILSMVICLSLVVRATLVSLHNISPDEIQRVQDLYMTTRNSSTNMNESSLMVAHIRAVLQHNEL